MSFYIFFLPIYSPKYAIIRCATQRSWNILHLENGLQWLYYVSYSSHDNCPSSSILSSQLEKRSQPTKKP